MAKTPKKKQTKKVNVLKNAPSKKEEKDDMVEEEFWEEIEFDCPKRGRIKQKVKVKRLKARKPEVEIQVIPTKSINIDDKDSGLDIFGSIEDPELNDSLDTKE